MTQSAGGLHTTILTDGVVPASSKSAITDNDGKITGISLTWDSDEPCPSTQGATTSFTARVTCDPMQSNEG